MSVPHDPTAAAGGVNGRWVGRGLLRLRILHSAGQASPYGLLVNVSPGAYQVLLAVRTGAKMVDREDILGKIRALAEKHGTSPSKKTFKEETGIPDHVWEGKLWVRWNDAINEAGFSGKTWGNDPLDREKVLFRYVSFVSEIGKIPTVAEIAFRRNTDQNFPSIKGVTSAIGTGVNRAKLSLEFAKQNGSGEQVLHILGQEIARHSHVAPVLPNDVETNSTGFVYLVKSGGHHKIGKTSSPDRRVYEIGLQLPLGLELIHSIATDDPSGIETYWHNRFKNKRLNGEWFNLSAQDIKAFKLRKKFM